MVPEAARGPAVVWAVTDSLASVLHYRIAFTAAACRKFGKLE